MRRAVDDVARTNRWLTRLRCLLANISPSIEKMEYLLGIFWSETLSVSPWKIDNLFDR